MRNKYTKRMRGGELRRNVGTRKLSVNMNTNSLIQYGSSKFDELFSRFYALERRGSKISAPPAKPRRVTPEFIPVVNFANKANNNSYHNRLVKSIYNARNKEWAIWKAYIEKLNIYEQLLSNEERLRPIGTHHNRFKSND